MEGWFKLSRSPQSRLFDNIGRRIRHINADLKKNPDAFREAGLKRQKANLEEFRDELRQRANQNGGKLTQDQINDATYEMKTNENLTTDKKKIDEITMKMEMSQQEMIDEILEEEPEQEDTGFDDPDIEALNDLFFSDISGKYIGQSGDPDARNTAFDIIEKANEYLKRDLSERDKAYLNRLTNNLSSALASKGARGVLYSIS